MAKIALEVAGAVVGGLLALPTGGMSVLAGAQLGLMAGGLAGGLLFPGKVPTNVGPQLNDRTVSSSANGTPINFGFGTDRIAGQVIWSTGIKETKSTQTQSVKGGPSQTTVTYSYSASLAIAWCEGPAKVLRIWADTKLIYDQGGAIIDTSYADSQKNTYVAPVPAPAVYSGDEAQMPDPTMQAAIGIADCPAHRGLCYVVYEDLPLANFGNRIPMFRAEIAYDGAQPSYTKDTWAPSGAHGTKLVTIDPSNHIAFTLDSTLLFGQRVNLTTGLVEFSGALQPWSGTELGVISGGVSSCGIYGLVVDGDGNLWGAAYISGVSGGYPALCKYDPATFAKLDEINIFSLFGLYNPVVILGHVAQGGTEYIYAFSATNNGSRIFRFDVKAKTLSGWANYIPDSAWNQPAYLSVDGDENIYIVTKRTDSSKWSLFVIETSSGISLSTGNWVYWQTTQYSADGTIGNGVVSFWDQASKTCIVASDGGGLFKVDPSQSFAIVSKTLAHIVDVASLPLVAKAQRGVCFGDGTFYCLAYGSQTLLRINASDLSINGEFDLTKWVPGLGTIDDMMFDTTGGNLLLVTGGNLYRLHLDFAGPAIMSDVITNICTRAGLASTDLDVSPVETILCDGYTVTRPSDAKSCLDPLTKAFFFDLVESDFLLKAVPRGGDTVLTITEDDLGIAGDAAKITETIGQSQDLPKEVSIVYIDSAINYQTGKQGAARHSLAVRTKNQVILQYPIVMDADTARQTAEKYLYLAYLERKPYTIKSARARYMRLDPGDVVGFVLEGMTFEMRVTKSTIGVGYSVEINGVSEDASAYLSTAAGSAGLGFVASSLIVAGPTTLFLADLPLLRDTDASRAGTSGYYFAMAAQPGDTAWKGAVLYWSSDDESYDQEGFSSDDVIYGSTVNALGDPVSPWSWDRLNTLTVRLADPTQTLSGTTDINVLNGANGFVVNGEICQFRDAVQNPDGTVTLSMLLRGRRGTEGACTGHVVGEQVVFLNLGIHREEISAATIGQKRYFRGITLGATLTSVPSQDITFAGNDLKPYAPVQISGTRNGGGDLAITWLRRTRIGGDWADQVDVPLSEDSELYDVEIIDSLGAVKRTFSNLATPTCTYLASDQTTDFGAPEAAIPTVRVYQRSAIVGRGFPGVALDL